MAPDPAIQPDQAEILVCAATELPPGKVRLVDVGRYGVGVYNVAGEYHALLNYCPHMGAPVCLGPISGVAATDENRGVSWTRSGEIVECPWHGSRFRMTDGHVRRGPALYDQPSYEVRSAEGGGYEVRRAAS